MNLLQLSIAAFVIAILFALFGFTGNQEGRSVRSTFRILFGVFIVLSVGLIITALLGYTLTP